MVIGGFVPPWRKIQGCGPLHVVLLADSRCWALRSFRRPRSQPSGKITHLLFLFTPFFPLIRCVPTFRTFLSWEMSWERPGWTRVEQYVVCDFASRWRNWGYTEIDDGPGARSRAFFRSYLSWLRDTQRQWNLLLAGSGLNVADRSVSLSISFPPSHSSLSSLLLVPGA